MSLSAEDRKSVWDGYRDSLTRIKTQLSDRKSPIKIRTPTRSPAGGKGSHSPYGRYRQSTPPYLPRLETPPDQKRKASNLRGNRYEVVPPVRDARGYDSRNTDHDSWGEESDDEPDVDPGHYMPYPHQYTAPPQVVFGAPFPVFYPPPPPPVKSQKRRRPKTENDYAQPQTRYKSPGVGRQPLSERYEDVNQSLPSRTKKKQNQRVHFSHPPPPMNGYVGYPGYPTYVYPSYYSSDDYYGKEKKGKKYKYIEPRDTPYSPSDIHGNHVYNRFKDEPDRLLVYYMKEHPLFSENFVNWFVNQTLDELIPDVMIEALNDIGRMVCNSHVYILPRTYIWAEEQTIRDFRITAFRSANTHIEAFLNIILYNGCIVTTAFLSPKDM